MCASLCAFSSCKFPSCENLCDHDRGQIQNSSITRIPVTLTTIFSLPLPSSWQPLTCSPLLLFCHFKSYTWNHIIGNQIRLDFFPPLNRVPLKSIQVVTSITNLFLVITEHCSGEWMYHSGFNHSPTGGYLDRFQFGVVTNKDAMSICAEAFV